MVGGQWVAHPGNATVTYDIEITKPEDPIVAGISNFRSPQSSITSMWIPATRYSQRQHSTPTPFPWIEGTVMPVIWKRHWGKGRVFYSSLGQNR